MRILWVATKPPCPPVDGGRLVALLTIQALERLAHRITLVAPVAPDAAGGAGIVPGVEQTRLVPSRPRRLAPAAVRSLLSGTPLTVGRHEHPAVRREVARLLAGGGFDLVHAEQPQALAQAGPARAFGTPVVLRAQNVESDLWRGAARGAGWLRPVLALEARRLAAFEGRAVRGVAETVALTPHDAARLDELSGGARRVCHVPSPFPGVLPGASQRLPGAPAVVLFGSGGWRPNEEGARWFVAQAWPRVRAALPGATLHVLGARVPEGPGVVLRAAPADSREAFADGAVLVVPLHVASGVRMKILEAWARGVPVVATPAAARGLDATDGQELLLARDADGFAAALGRLHGEPGLARWLVAAGRRRLAAEHDPASVAARLCEVYERVVGRK